MFVFAAFHFEGLPFVLYKFSLCYGEWFCVHFLMDLISDSWKSKWTACNLVFLSLKTRTWYLIPSLKGSVQRFLKLSDFVSRNLIRVCCKNQHLLSVAFRDARIIHSATSGISIVNNHWYYIIVCLSIISIWISLFYC